MFSAAIHNEVYAGFLGHGGREMRNEAVVEWFRNQVLGAEIKRLAGIGAGNLLAESLEVSIATFRRLVRDDKLAARAEVGRSRLFAVADLKAFSRQRKAIKG